MCLGFVLIFQLSDSFRTHRLSRFSEEVCGQHPVSGHQQHRNPSEVTAAEPEEEAAQGADAGRAGQLWIWCEFPESQLKHAQPVNISLEINLFLISHI